MISIILSAHILVTIGMIGLILLQKSEGTTGAGFSGASVESMMRPRARPNPLSRATMVMAIAFFVTSLGLALFARPHDTRAPSIMGESPAGAGAVPKIDETPAPPPGAAAPAAPAQPAGPTVPNN